MITNTTRVRNAFMRSTSKRAIQAATAVLGNHRILHSVGDKGKSVWIAELPKDVWEAARKAFNDYLDRQAT